MSEKMSPSHQMFIDSQFKKLLFKTEDVNGKTKIVYNKQLLDVFNVKRLQEDISYNNLFLMLYEGSTFFVLVFQLVLYNLVAISKFMEIYSIFQLCFYVLLKIVLLLLIYFKKIISPRLKQTNVFINITLIYTSLIVTIFALAFQNSPKYSLSEIQFLIYYTIKSGCFYIILLDVSLWYTLVATNVVDYFLIFFLSFYFSYYTIIYPLVSFKISMNLICGILKYKQNSLTQSSFEFQTTFERFIKRTNMFYNEMNINCFIFKNQELILLSEIAQKLLQDFNRGNDLDSFVNIEESEETTLHMIPNNEKLRRNLTVKNELLINCFSKIFASENNSEYFKQKKNLYEIITTMITDILSGARELKREAINTINLGRFESMEKINGSRQYYEIDLTVDLSTSAEDAILQLRLVDINDKIQIEAKFKELENKLEELMKKEKKFKHQAHEIKTPLNCIIGCSHQFISNISKGEISQNSILKTATRLRSISNYSLLIIHDMISKNEGLIELNKCNQKVLDILNFCFDIMNSLLFCDERKNKNVKPVFNVSSLPEDLTIITDAVKLKQILLNFISNAIKFTHKGYIKLEANIQNRELISDLNLNCNFSLTQLATKMFRIF
jgi:hypothetical protein